MTGIDDLRGALVRRADEATRDSLDTTSRAAQVHGRVATVRRRRRAGGAVAVVAAAATVAGIVGATTLLPGGGDESTPATPPDGADTVVAGARVPTELVSLGWTYELRGVAEDEGRAGIDLPASDVPRIVTWAAEGDGGVVVDHLGERVRYAEAAFGDLVAVAPGSDDEVDVVAQGDDAGTVAVAVYELVDVPALVPDGITDEGVTFRRDVADRTLVQAAVGAPGESEVQLPLVGSREGQMGLSLLCVGAPDGSLAEIDVDGAPGVTVACNDTTTFDPGGGTTIDDLVHSSALVDLRVTDAAGRLLEDDDVQLGLGVYVAARGAERVLGALVPQVIERDGRRWELERVVEGVAGVRELRATTEDEGRPTWVEVIRSGTGLLQPSVDGRPRTEVSSEVPGPGTSGIGLASAGADVRVGLRPSDDGDLLGALVFYRLAE